MQHVACAERVDHCHLRARGPVVVRSRRAGRSAPARATAPPCAGPERGDGRDRVGRGRGPGPAAEDCLRRAPRRSAEITATSTCASSRSRPGFHEPPSSSTGHAGGPGRRRDRHREVQVVAVDQHGVRIAHEARGLVSRHGGGAGGPGRVDRDHGALAAAAGDQHRRDRRGSRPGRRGRARRRRPRRGPRAPGGRAPRCLTRVSSRVEAPSAAAVTAAFAAGPPEVTSRPSATSFSSGAGTWSTRLHDVEHHEPTHQDGRHAAAGYPARPALGADR